MLTWAGVALAEELCCPKEPSSEMVIAARGSSIFSSSAENALQAIRDSAPCCIFIPWRTIRWLGRQLLGSVLLSPVWERRAETRYTAKLGTSLLVMRLVQLQLPCCSRPSFGKSHFINVQSDAD